MRARSRSTICSADSSEPFRFAQSAEEPGRHATSLTLLDHDGAEAVDPPAQLAGIRVSWSVDTHGHVFPAHGGAAEEDYPHVVVDRDGIEWTVREVPTPQAWARASHCLVLSSRECVRRIWSFPESWRSLDADELLELGRAD